MIKQLFIILICIVFIYDQGYCLRPVASNISPRRSNPVFSEIKTLSGGQNNAQIKPASYIVPNISDAQWKQALAELDGPIVDISMEAILPELGPDAHGGSRGGLGILEGDSGEGYAKSIIGSQVSGVRPFIAMPMYEYRIVPETDVANKRQYLRKIKVDYNAIIDFNHLVDFRVFADTDRFSYPELERDKEKPIKIVADTNGRQLKFDVIMYDPLSSMFRNFKAAVFVTSRGGTPAFMISCIDVDDILYTDSQEGRLSQQVLMGKVVPELLKTLGIKPSIVRVNEAHTVIAMAEMIEDPYFADTAYVFTNHTPITAGLQIYYGRGEWFSMLNLPQHLKHIFVDENDNLNFSRAAMILAHMVNGVSNAHKITLQDMFPEFKDKIRGILNGTGEFWKSDRLIDAEKKSDNLTSLQLYNIHKHDKAEFISLLEKRTGIKLNPDMPIVSAIRRIDYYKQQIPMLKPIIMALCQDKGVKTAINIDSRVMQVEGLGMQVVVGGIIVNEHNNDLQSWIAEFVSWMQEPAFKGRFVFVSGNDVELMKSAAKGTDSWIEVPRRNPETGHQEEASGTSGMRAAINGNIPIMSSGMWGDEWIGQYDPVTGKGNGFILEQINPLELYQALSAVSDLYYGYINQGDNSWIEFRKNVYEDANVLYIKNMIKRYVLEVFLPAIRAKKAEDAVKGNSRLLPLAVNADNPEQGSEITISAEIDLDNISVLDSIKTQVWTDINSKGAWYAADMSQEIIEKTGKPAARFSVKIALHAPGEFAYKVRFIIKDNDRVIYMPEGFGSNLNITVSGPSVSSMPESAALYRTILLNKSINSAA